MKDFETELATLIGEEIITPVINTTYGIVQADIAMRKIITLVADTLLKAIGEDEKLPIMEMQPYLWAERNARNYQRADIKAKVFKELGIKEKV